MAMQHNMYQSRLAYLHDMSITGYWSYAGPLDAPLNFSVTRSNTSNTSFTLSWGAPFSLHNTQGLADIFNYILCTNTTCRTIPSKPNCKYPRHCISFVNLAGEQSIGTASYDASIEFSLSAVNGAGEGLKAKCTFVSVQCNENSPTCYCIPGWKK